jgi:hypothetical protein
MRNWLSGLALIAMAIAALFIGTSSQSASADEQATGKVQITRVEYNVKGVDTASNAYLESVKVKNLGADMPMSGWTLQDLTGHTYHFPSTWDDPSDSLTTLVPYVLKAGQEVNVRTGVKPASFGGWWSNKAINLYWNRSSHMYGNAADSVTLENAGNVVDRVAWNDFTIRP